MRLITVLAFCLLPSLPSGAQSLPSVELLHAFRPAPGSPVGGLARGADGSFYGLTARVLYRVTPGGAFSVAHTFDAASIGTGAPTIGPDGALYGIVTQDAQAAVFRFDPATSAYRLVHAFDTAADGRGPVGTLALGPDAQLYGATRASLGPETSGTIYRLDPVTGAASTLHEFRTAASSLRYPFAGLVEAGGRLYGTAWSGGSSTSVDVGAGGIFRVDPTTGAVTTVHLFSGSDGRGPQAALTRTADGWLYGSTVEGGASNHGVIFRFDPQAPNPVVEVVHSLTGLDGYDPSQLVEAADGHLYGVTRFAGGIGASGIFRLRRQPGGGHAFEVLHTFATPPPFFDPGAAEALAIGLDGFLYGTTTGEGFTEVGGLVYGTIYRFDPLAAGGPGNPIQFVVLHDFPQGGHDWHPSLPVRLANGNLYGTTSRGGSTLRGAVYRLDGASGQLAILGPLPGAADPTRRIANSALVLADDGQLYGTTTAVNEADAENRIVRVDPATGIATTATLATSTSPQDTLEGLTRTPTGTLYGIRQNGVSATAFRFDPATNGVTTVAVLPARSLRVTTSRLVAATDGRLYLAAVQWIRSGLMFESPIAELVRLDPTAGSFVTVASLGVFQSTGAPVPTPAGALVVGLSGNDARVVEARPDTGAVRVLCGSAFSGGSPAFGADGALYVASQRLRRCDPATGALLDQGLSESAGDGQLGVLAGVIHGAAPVGGLYGGGTLFRLNFGGLPGLDTDGDGLSNAWESRFELDPFRSDGADGADGDPDGDGRTNAQEEAAGTHPRGLLTRLFAEGATGSFFRTRLDVTNTAAVPATLLARFQTDAGQTVSTTVVVPPLSHLAIDPSVLPGLGNASFSTIVEADAAIAVARTMEWDASGYGSHLETGIPAASTTWYFAEGSTSADFALFYLLQNPGDLAAAATVRYLRPAGSAPIERVYVLAPHSRLTIPVDAQAPELASTDVSAIITATAPIVAERAMYLSRPGQPFAAGHASAGVTAPALEWFVAEGATGPFFDLFVLIANPNPAAAAVSVEFLLAGGGVVTRDYVVAANSRFTIWVDDQEIPVGSGQRPLANVAVSTVVRSTNAQPVIVERAMWWPGPEVSSAIWYEAHGAAGSTVTATRWVVAGGEVGGPDNAETYVLIANPGTAPARARVTFVPDSGLLEARDYDLPPKSRTNVAISADFSSFYRRFGVTVDSLGAVPVPLVVESATYASPGGVVWARGSSATATPMP